MNTVDLTGRVFGRLTVLKLDHKEPRPIRNGKKDGYFYFWLCKCECGNIIIIKKEYFFNNKTKSCGCYTKDNPPKRTHGMSDTRIYEIWKNMKRRCYDKTNHRFLNYGGRGITICDEWRNDFVSFHKWAIDNGYTNELTIDRIKVDGNYEPSNCKWSTKLEQSYNTTRTHYLTYNGKTQCISQWAKELNLTCSAIQHRLQRNWTLDRIFTTPLRTANV